MLILRERRGGQVTRSAEWRWVHWHGRVAFDRLRDDHLLDLPGAVHGLPWPS